MHCKRLHKMKDLHGVCTVFARGAHTTSPRRSRRPHSVLHSVLSNTLWKRQTRAFVPSMLKRNAAAWCCKWFYSVCTAFARRCWRLHSAHLGVLQFFKRCGKAVRMPLWCDRSFKMTFTKKWIFLLFGHTRMHRSCRSLLNVVK